MLFYIKYKITFYLLLKDNNKKRKNNKNKIFIYLLITLESLICEYSSKGKRKDRIY